MTPKEIVAELDKYIIGQEEAKKSVAIALRNRYRRSLLSEKMREEITPKNILMMGPTGCGKTEIARRLAKLMEAPFVKVEATKFTEVGYVGRDVDSMVRDLVEASIRITKQAKLKEKYDIADGIAEEKILEAIIPGHKRKTNPAETNPNNPFAFIMNNFQQPQQPQSQEPEKEDTGVSMAREQVRQQLRDGLLEDQFIEIEVTDEALQNAEQNGIIFIDEIDKIASSSSVYHGADVSREGVQRDILPIVEGSVVNTKYGPVKTDHILFIGAGAVHTAKPTALIPELQGRFPIRVELQSLTKDSFVKILTVPENAIIKQNQALLETEGVSLAFTDDAIDEIASMAFLMNEQTENIGARRLHTIMEKLLEDISFEVPGTESDLTIDREYVRDKFSDTIDKDDVDKYIL